jgi:transcriptional/translational regulatory protein YebC/TACO1
MAKRNKDLPKAGERIRSQAMSRRGSNTVSTDDGDENNSVLCVKDRLEDTDDVGKESGSR